MAWPRSSHLTVGGGAHRGLQQTLAMVARMGWWPELASDVESWWLDCGAGARNRGRALKGIGAATEGEGTGDALYP